MDPLGTTAISARPDAQGGSRWPGALLDERGVAHFCVWAPQARQVEVAPDDGEFAPITMQRTADGYFVATATGLSAGALYKYRVDGQGPWPDPCSRFQPQGPHGASQLVAPDRYQWRDSQWSGVSIAGQVIYELHVGTFTPVGTFDAAQERLLWLKELGVTLIEIMPIAEFPGRWNWGYDGVQLYAPFHGYGDHEALKRFVDAAHATGLGVILDVVYNHLGPDGNYLRCFSPDYFSTRHTDWGEALNFDGPGSEGMRTLIIENGAYWVREFHIDGFRLDATQAIVDDSREHVVAALVTRARAEAAPRNIVFIAENEPQCAEHLQGPGEGGQGLDAMWNDDFHHAAHVALTGNRDAYFHDYTGRAQELISAIRHGFLYQGQYYHWQKKPRGSPLRHMAAFACVHFLQNHDQVGNTYLGDRLHTMVHPGRYRALTTLLLLGPQTPLLFMGQEFMCSQRFAFFADHEPELGRLVWQGRRDFMRQFRAYATAAVQAKFRDPAEESSFTSAKLDWSEVDARLDAVQLHRDLLGLRRADPVIAAQDVTQLEGATLATHAFVLRWYDDVQGDRLLVINLDRELVLDPAPEPLLAPATHSGWTLLWSSEEPRYGGSGAINPVSPEQQWRIPANCATLLCDASTL